MEEVTKIMKKMVRKAIKLCVFFAIVNLPFITVSQLISIDVFLDSFEEPDHYHYIQGSGISMEPTIGNGDYVLLQKSSHPDFFVETGDIILYIKDNGESVCHRVYYINGVGSFKRYHTMGDNNNLADKPIYENHIMGKIVSVVANNIWNAISMEIWDVSIHDFNINTL